MTSIRRPMGALPTRYPGETEDHPGGNCLRKEIDLLPMNVYPDKAKHYRLLYQHFGNGKWGLSVLSKSNGCGKTLAYDGL